MVLFFGICLSVLLWSYADFRIGQYLKKKHWVQRDYPIRNGNLQLITKGQELYKTYFADLQESTSSILILFYIVKNDRFSKLFFDSLIERAEKGLKVHLLLDRVGSRLVPKEWIRLARKKGIHIAFCNRPRFPLFFHSLQQRNHQKITIMDGRIGYLGGYNIGKEYIDLQPALSPWRDYHLRIQGEGIQDLIEVFSLDWQRATSTSLPKLPPSDFTVGEMAHRFFPSEGVGVEEMLLNKINQAQKSIIIGTPYFIPSIQVLSALLKALEREVEVTILVPKKSDHPFVKEASYRYLRKILAQQGIVYQYKEGFFHAKVMVFDSSVCDIGTANFDRRSFFINHEMNCFIYHLPFIKTVETALAEDIKRSTRLSLQTLQQVPWNVRWREWIARLIEGLL